MTPAEAGQWYFVRARESMVWARLCRIEGSYELTRHHARNARAYVRSGRTWRALQYTP